MEQLLRDLHEGIIVKMIPPAQYVPTTLVLIGGLFLAAVLVIGFMSVIAMLWIYLERRVAGWIQVRYGPNRVGPAGILQSLADGIKLLTKEDVVPTAANRFLYELAPVLVFAGAFIPFAALPFSQHLVIADLDLGVFYILAFGSLEVVGVLMAGWAPNSKWSLYGGMRLAAQMLSYEIPLGLSILTVVLLAGSLNLTEIVLWQTQGFFIWDGTQLPWILEWLHWGVFRSPATFLAFFIFCVAGLAESKRAPFDLPEAESELVSGFHTEYTGIRFSYFFLAEYCAMYVICVLGAVLFLGGWHWPLPTPDYGRAGVIPHVMEGFADVSYEGLGAMESVRQFANTVFVLGPTLTWEGLVEMGGWKAVLSELAGFLNLLMKASLGMFAMLWIRWTLPRVRIDQVMHICLKVLLPFGLAFLLMAAVQAALTQPAEVTAKELKRNMQLGLGAAALVEAAEEEAEQAAEEGAIPADADVAEDIEGEAEAE